MGTQLEVEREKRAHNKNAVNASASICVKHIDAHEK